MRFWDSSALVPLLVQEGDSARVQPLVGADPAAIVWAATAVEIASALWRRSRAGGIADKARDDALRELARQEVSWHAVVDIATVGARARRLLASHPLRAADACQLAAALVACRERSAALDFVTLDDRLGEAARKEGFRVLPEH
jgi:predicted nucleic acid-binding protein